MEKSPGILFDEAFSHHEKGLLPEAEAGYRDVLATDPDHAEALHFLGVLLHQKGEFEAAIKSIRHADQLTPGNPTILYNLGVVLQEAGDFEEAEIPYRNVVELSPGHISAWVNLGNLLSDKGAHAEAIECHRNALKLQPDLAEHHLRLGTSLRRVGDIEGAMTQLGVALTLAPDDAGIHSALIETSPLEPGIDFQALAARTREWSRRHAPRDTPPFSGQSKSLEDDSPLRIGFMMTDQIHSLAPRILPPLLEVFQRDPTVYTVCYANRRLSCPRHERSRKASDLWQEIAEIPDGPLYQQIRADQIDILIDLAGHAPGNRLSVVALRAAPVQISWMGAFDGSGMAAFDYLLTDEILLPGTHGSVITELPIHLSRHFVAREAPSDAPPISEPPLGRQGYPTFGCLAPPEMISYPIIQIWSELLHRSPDARLLLVGKGMEDPAIRTRLAGLFTSQGVAPERIRLLQADSESDAFAACRHIDLALDPAPVSSYEGAFRALWMGVPVVTCPGDAPSSRLANSLLHFADIEGSMAGDWGQYIDLALHLVEEKSLLTEVRHKIRPLIQASQIFDHGSFADELLRRLREIHSHSQA